jgi:hypothetical protein
MSAVCVAIAPDGRRGFMLTDCAAYNLDDGLFAGFGAKATPIPHAGAVIASRGPMALCAWAAATAQVFPDFDSIAANLAEALARALPMARKISGPGEVEMFCMGYSEREKRVLAFFARSDSPTPLSIEFGTLLFGPNVDNQDLARLRFPNPSQVRADNTALPRGLLNVMQYQRERAIAQREAAAKAGKATRAEIIGGAAVLTTITEKEITQRVIHRWPDVIGEPIKLAAVAA